MAAAPKKHRVIHGTYLKWRRDFDRDCCTASWLECETELECGKKFVTRLKCSVCTKFKDHIKNKRNYSDKWLVGVDSV